MNSNNEGSYEQVELKYCERCGGLFLRPQGSGRAYCKPCMPLMAELPQAKARRTVRDVRLPVATPKIEMEGSVIELWAVAEVGS
jgi:hypothetical protein